MFLLILYLVVTVMGSNPECLKWGNTFDVSLDFQNIRMDCKKPDGRSVCCAAVSNRTNLPTRGVGIDFSKTMKSVKDGKMRCEIQKVYISSPQEIRDLETAKFIEGITDPQVKLDALLDYVTSDEVVSNSTTWLGRISIHMQSERIPPETAADNEFLSYFAIKRICGDVVDEWKEWIEPVSITARHPFGFGRCRNTGRYYSKKPKVGRSNTDYVLLQSGYALHNASHSHTGSRFLDKDRRGGGKHYLLDAGTSTFDSSLYWFTCGYSQVCVQLLHSDLICLRLKFLCCVLFSAQNFL